MMWLWGDCWWLVNALHGKRDWWAVSLHLNVLQRSHGWIINIAVILCEIFSLSFAPGNTSDLDSRIPVTRLSRGWDLMKGEWINTGYIFPSVQYRCPICTNCMQWRCNITAASELLRWWTDALMSHCVEYSRLHGFWRSSSVLSAFGQCGATESRTQFRSNKKIMIDVFPPPPPNHAVLILTDWLQQEPRLLTAAGSRQFSSCGSQSRPPPRWRWAPAASLPPPRQHGSPDGQWGRRQLHHNMDKHSKC